MGIESVKRQFDLSGKTAIITGGAGFLGLHFGDAIAEMGGVPIMFDIDRAAIDKALSELKKKGYSEYDGIKTDITDKLSCQSGVDKVVKKYGKIDILINNAALTKKGCAETGEDFFAPFEEYSETLWEKGLKVNLTGTFLITQAVGKVMKAKKRGVVINIASDVGVISPDHRIYQKDEKDDYPGVPFNTPISYSTTKAAIINFTRHLATYWAPYNIRVNALSPAGVYKNHDPKFVKKLAERIPLGRMATPEEYKGAIVFLASEASSFMTGANLIIDGGRTCW